MKPWFIVLGFVTACQALKTPAPHEPALGQELQSEDAARRIVEAPDRTPEDRSLDAGRHPARLLSFLNLRPGMRVAEIAAGTGYTTELLARAVAPTGQVFGQNSRFVLNFAERAWAERLSKEVNNHVTRVDRELEDPLPREAKNLDGVVNVLFYHDTATMKFDRGKMNRAIFAALRPGGFYVIVDHAAKDGAGLGVCESLHRIDEAVVRAEVTSAGFRLVKEGNFLRNPADTRDWNASPRAAGERRGTTDRFVLRFEKP